MKLTKLSLNIQDLHRYEMPNASCCHITDEKRKKGGTSHGQLLTGSWSDLLFKNKREDAAEATTAELSIISPAFTNHNLSLRLESVSVSQAFSLLARVKAISLKLEKANWFCKVALSPQMDNQNLQTHTRQRSTSERQSGPSINFPALQLIHSTYIFVPFLLSHSAFWAQFLWAFLSAITSHTEVISTLDQQRLFHSSESVTNAEWIHPYFEGFWALHVVLHSYTWFITSQQPILSSVFNLN